MRARPGAAATAATSTSAGASLPQGRSRTVSRKPRMTATSGLIGGACRSLRELARDELARRRRELGLGGAARVARRCPRRRPRRPPRSRRGCTRSFSCSSSWRCAPSMRCCTLCRSPARCRARRSPRPGSRAGRAGAAAWTPISSSACFSSPRDLQVRGDDVGQLVRVRRPAAPRTAASSASCGLQLHVARELVGDAARQAAAARRPAVGARDGRVRRPRSAARCVVEALDAHALLALDERLDAAVRQLEELQHADARAHGRDVVEAWGPRWPPRAGSSG